MAGEAVGVGVQEEASHRGDRNHWRQKMHMTGYEFPLLMNIAGAMINATGKTKMARFFTYACTFCVGWCAFAIAEGVVMQLGGK
jgi:hypothetical protein